MNQATHVLVLDGSSARDGRPLAGLDSDDDLSVSVETDVAAGLDRVEDEDVDCVVGLTDDTAGVGLLVGVRDRCPRVPFVLATDGTTLADDLAAADAAVGLSDGVTVYRRRDEATLTAAVRDAIQRDRAERDARQTRRRYRSLVEQNLVGIYVINDRTFEYVNPRLAELFGYDPDELVGAPVGDLVAPEDRERVLDNLDRRTRGDVESLQYSFTALRKSGERIFVEVHGSRLERDGESVVMGTLIDRTRERRHNEALGRLYEVTQRLTRSTDSESICETAVESATTILNLPKCGIFLREPENERLEPAVLGDAFGPVDGDVREASGEAYREGEFRVVDREGDGEVAVAPLGDHGVFVTVADSPRGVDGGNVELLKLLAANVEAALDRAGRERQLNRLHAATRRLMDARTREEVATIATETARDVLGLSVSSVHGVGDEGDLAPLSWTDDAEDLFGEIPTFTPGNSVAWRVYEKQEPEVYGDVREADNLYDEATSIRSEMVFPLGDHGVFLAGSPRSDEFDDALVSLAKVFTANVETALDRADREERLRQREAEFRRQSERLGEFASVVSHDLRNPLGVAQGHLEIAREEYDDDHLDAIDAAHERMRSLIDDLLTLARQGQAVGETEPVDLRLLVTEAWTAVAGGDLRVPDDLGTIQCDADRVRELLVNLFTNAVDHGGDDVTVTVGRLDGGGFYVADDGPGIPPADRERVFERGVTTHEEGTGFGLAIVRSIAEAHGWSVAATESEDGGARFEVRT